MTRDIEASTGLRRILRQYQAGEATVAEILKFEAEFALDADLSPSVREVLDRVALVAEEVAANLRPESELRELALQLVGSLLTRVSTPLTWSTARTESREFAIAG